MKWRFLIGALLIGAGLCNPSYGFEWLDRLIGIDLDNSQGRRYGAYYSGYAPYSMGYPSTVGTFGYDPYMNPYMSGYAPSAGYGYQTVAPSFGYAPQTSYRTSYESGPVTNYQPVTSCPCGN